jgi:hypothetical protein
MDGPDATEPMFVVENVPGGGVSLHIPSPDPVEITAAKAQEIRLAIGAALGEGDDGS